MTLRDFMAKRAPRGVASDMEAESRTWMVRCRSCGHERSIWELGGVRYRARGRPKTLIRCRNCGRIRWADIYRKEPDEQ